MNILLLLLNAAALALLFLLSAFFSGSETVFFSLSPVQVQRIRKLRPKVGQRLDVLLKDPAMLLSTILVGNTLVNFAIASLSFLLLESLCPKWAEIISIPLVTALLLVFGEVTLKRIAMHGGHGNEKLSLQIHDGTLCFRCFAAIGFHNWIVTVVVIHVCIIITP